MSGDKVWMAKDAILVWVTPCLMASLLLLLSVSWLRAACLQLVSAMLIIGFIPGCIGETSVIAIAIGAVILLWTGIASWKTMGSVFAGGIVMALIFQALDMTPIAWYEHIVLGGFCLVLYSWLPTL